MPTLSEGFKFTRSSVLSIGHFIGGGSEILHFETDDLHSLREWWHTILRTHGKYPCFAVFLVLASDTEGAFFWGNFGEEIHRISGKECLVIVLGSDYFYTGGLQRQRGLFQVSDNFWVEAHGKHITSGESLKVAEIFNIEITQFPCVIFFADVRSANYVLVSLKELDPKQIGQELRGVFAAIKAAVRAKKDVLAAIRTHENTRRLQNMQSRVIEAAASLGTKTIEVVMDAWVKALLK